MAKAIQAATDDSVELAFVDQGYTGAKPALAAPEHGITLDVVKLSEAKRGFVLLPRRWVVERSFAWAIRFRRLVKDYERCAQTLADLHIVAFVSIMLKNVAQLHGSPYQPLVGRPCSQPRPGYAARLMTGVDPRPFFSFSSSLKNETRAASFPASPASDCAAAVDCSAIAAFCCVA